MRAGVVRAEGPVVTSALSSDTVLLQRLNSSTNIVGPVQITVSNLFAGGADTPNVNIGASGIAGTLKIFPSTASKGDLKIVATNNTGNTETTITNAAMGQASVISIPDPANATANFVLDHGDASIISGNIIAATAGKGLQVKEGSNARMGTATLVAGTVTISNTSVTANTRIFLSRYSIGSSVGAIGVLSVGTVTANTSFVINALKTTDHTVETADVSVVHWMLVEPAA